MNLNWRSARWMARWLGKGGIALGHRFWPLCSHSNGKGLLRQEGYKPLRFTVASKGSGGEASVQSGGCVFLVW